MQVIIIVNRKVCMERLQVSKQTSLNKGAFWRQVQHGFRSVAVTCNQPMADYLSTLDSSWVCGSGQEAIWYELAIW